MVDTCFPYKEMTWKILKKIEKYLKYLRTKEADTKRLTQVIDRKQHYFQGWPYHRLISGIMFIRDKVLVIPTSLDRPMIQRY